MRVVFITFALTLSLFAQVDRGNIQGTVTDAFRVLPRDEGAVADAIGRRGALGGAIGRALDELAELLVIDAT